MTLRVWPCIVAALLGLHCSSDSSDTSTSSSAITEAQPASAAGTSTENGPGVPADFGGTVRDSMPLTAEEVAAIEAANALQAARNPPTKSRTDVGFGRVPAKKTTAATQGDAP